MKSALIAVVLASVASAQVAVDAQSDGIAAAARAARDLGKKFAPASVDPKPVAALTDRLSKDWTEIRTAKGEIGHVLARRTAPDARGNFRGIQVELVEIRAQDFGGRSGAAFNDLVMRRYFSRLEAAVDDWSVDPETGVGRLDEWSFVVSLDDRLLSVERSTAPVEPVAPGDAEPNLKMSRVHRVDPADPEAQERWKSLSVELLTLGKTVEI